MKHRRYILFIYWIPILFIFLGCTSSVKKTEVAAQAELTNHPDPLDFVARVNIQSLPEKKVVYVTLVGNSLHAADLFLSVQSGFNLPLAKFRMKGQSCKLLKYLKDRQDFRQMPCSNQIWKAMLNMQDSLQMLPSDLIAILKVQIPPRWTCQFNPDQTSGLCTSPDHMVQARITHPQGGFPQFQITSGQDPRTLSLTLNMIRYNKTKVQMPESIRDFQNPESQQ